MSTKKINVYNKLFTINYNTGYYVVIIFDIVMNKSRILETLTSIGLSENEARIYLSCLSLGPSKVVSIAKDAQVKRTTAYSILDALQLKGLVTIEYKGLKQLFAAESPEHLSRILESRHTQLKQALPELSALFNLQGVESIVKHYEGLEGVKNVYESILKRVQPHDDYLVISKQEDWYNLDSEYFQRFIERRSKLPLRIRMLFQDSEFARSFKALEKNYGFEVRILPKNTTLNTNMVVTPQMLVIHQIISPVTAIVIENRSTIELHKQLFEIIWNSLELNNTLASS